MKWKDLLSFGAGAVFICLAWYVFEGGLVLTRGGYSSMTRETNPLAFWFEVATFTFIGAALLTYGLAGLLGYSNVTTKMETVAEQLPVLKAKTFVICALSLMLIASLGWLLFDELLRTSRLRAGGG